MFNSDFHNNYALGSFHTAFRSDFSGIKVKKYINSGVMLVNNEKIINDEKDAELLYYTIKNCKNLFFPTQDPINIVFNKKIGFLPLKYGYLFNRKYRRI